MRVADLLIAVDEFRQKLIQHRELWAQSISQPMPAYPVRNREELEAQSHWLTRRLGALRAFIERFDNQWIMVHPATGVRWDVLDAATSLNQVAQTKGPSIRGAIEKLNVYWSLLEGPRKFAQAPCTNFRISPSPQYLQLTAYATRLSPAIAVDGPESNSCLRTG